MSETKSPFQYVLSAVGGNVPGIVALLAGEIQASGCNIEDSSTGFLGGHFSVTILFSGEGEDLARELEERCGVLRKEHGFSVALLTLGPAAGGADTQVQEARYQLRVQGPDRVGIVYRTSRLLASLGINIVEMETRLKKASGRDTPVFTMRTRLVVPEGLEGKMLRKKVESLAEDPEDLISLTRIAGPAR
ncbi:MAG: hypothetical protein KKA60_11850 [Proteobacteria bacterium]|nr:hypothetical protein [Pseudomonadota bacterium]